MVPLQGLFKWTLNIPSKFMGDNQQTLQPTLSTTKGPVAKAHRREGTQKCPCQVILPQLYALPNVE